MAYLIFQNTQTFLWILLLCITHSIYSYFIDILSDKFWNTSIHVLHLFFHVFVSFFTLHCFLGKILSTVFQFTYSSTRIFNMWQLPKQELGNYLYLFFPLSSTSIWATSSAYQISIPTASAPAFRKSRLSSYDNSPAHKLSLSPCSIHLLQNWPTRTLPECTVFFHISRIFHLFKIIAFPSSYLWG